jgi:hypothetical protein
MSNRRKLKRLVGQPPISKPPICDVPGCGKPLKMELLRKDDGLDDDVLSFRVDTKEEAIKLTCDYVHSEGQHPLVEEDDGDKVVVGMYSRDGDPGDALVLYEDEEDRVWYCGERRCAF